MAPPDPAVMAQTIARFMQLEQERALDEKISSLQQTVINLQKRHDQQDEEINLQKRHDQQDEEISSLRETVTSLQNRHKQHEEEISSLKEEVKSLRTLPKEQDRPLGWPPPRPLPRGVKRARADDEAPRREEKRQSRPEVTMQSRVEDQTKTRQDEFVDHVKSACEEFENKEDIYEGDERAFICRFIDGIRDPVLSRWFQKSLKTWFPDRVVDERRFIPRAGGRIVYPTRDLTWSNVETVLKGTEWPPLDG